MKVVMEGVGYDPYRTRYTWIELDPVVLLIIPDDCSAVQTRDLGEVRGSQS